MGLFSTLLTQAKTTTTTESETTMTSNSSLSLPTVIQLYSEDAVEFVMEGAPPPSSTTTIMTAPGTLSYQAVEVAAVLQEAYIPEAVGLRSKKVVHPVPDLGVWDCLVTPSNKALVDALLQVPDSPNAFSFSVDLGKLVHVEPTITRCQEALVRYLIARRTSTTSSSSSSMPVETTTTTLYQLRSVQFGLAAASDSTKDAGATAAPSETDRSITVALLITVKVPLRELDENYKDKQARALMMYHLRRFAALLNATLVFYKEAEDVLAGDENSDAHDSDDNNHYADSQPALTLNQLALVWKAFAQGQSVWKEEFLPEFNVNLPEESPHSPIYGPDNHNQELIESVMLRNASYPGHWDAAKESVWTILPPPADDKSGNNADYKGKPAATTGDEHWLAELRDSVAAMNESIKTPSKKTGDATSTTPAGTTTKTLQPTPSDGDVSSFFENLLK